ncbi:MAG: DUF349 domain-containing protein [Flavobacteriaceae bacterium]|nr:DUF349 domain-containing protein [Flavobacteriaceae bacterium]
MSTEMENKNEEFLDINSYEEIEENEQTTLDTLSVKELLSEMENIVNKPDAGAHAKKFNQLKDKAYHLIQDEIADKKHDFVEEGNDMEDFSYEHPEQSKYSALVSIFKEKLDTFNKNQEKEHQENLEKRNQIIEKLKNLYINTEPNTNLFRAIREIKEEWANAGAVAKSEFKNLNHNYFHHLNQFYQMLDLNKEYREQEYAHNLEKRKSIIARAEELINEVSVQKALNELQYLHRLWKEEAEPVAEEFRDSTWEVFKEISNKIHERKSELLAQIEVEQQKALEKKNEIIAKLKDFASSKEAVTHNYWQQAIKQVEQLRSEFLKLGNVPKKLSNQNWTEFKTALRAFNTKKNDFYKNLKNSQHINLEEKQKLISIAQDNMHSEDWDTAVPLFKKLQEDWKNIGHVPKNQANKVWNDFRDACNTFFNNFREKNASTTDDWKQNYHQKKALLEELKQINDEEGSVEKIEQIKSSWDSIGKVPRNKMSINNEFNKVLKEKLKLNKINVFDLKEDNLTEAQLTDKARKIKSQIADLEAEVVKLENNINFFNNPSRENPLLKDTYDKIDEKKALIESLKQSLHKLITGE